MKKLIAWIPRQFTRMAAVLLSLALPSLSSADISNTATATYSDAAANNYSATSNTVNTVTPPVITSASTASGNLNVAIKSYTIVATNNPTSFTATGLPPGLILDSTKGIISGTPTSAGTFSVKLTASNAAGASAVFPLTLTILGAPNLVLTKSADKTTATSGTVVTYTIQYQNTGAGDATNVVIRDVIPTGTTWMNGSGGTMASGTLTWTIGTVTAGTAAQSVSFKVTAN